MSKVGLGFDPQPLDVPVENILPSRGMPPGLATSRKFRQIKVSIGEIRLIEPLTV